MVQTEVPGERGVRIAGGSVLCLPGTLGRIIIIIIIFHVTHAAYEAMA